MFLQLPAAVILEDETLEDSVCGTAHLMEEKVLNSKLDEEELKSWIDGLGL